MIVLKDPSGALLAVVEVSADVGEWQRRHPTRQVEASFVVRGERGFTLKRCEPDGPAVDSGGFRLVPL